ncbi:MAG: hypothetical protein JWN12_67 [Candidatus Saccharibacteria bacterium]|nr:hypothetical protein [Candidatus Saccharibacteria bacterium]
MQRTAAFHLGTVSVPVLGGQDSSFVRALRAKYQTYRVTPPDEREMRKDYILK